ncbi:MULTISPECIES: type I toxin-antitoxin system Fst family toxin [Staphylococcus]|nr:type I toxin-antitoxin system Fst family toxin [Staphylococcus xylosus]
MKSPISQASVRRREEVYYLLIFFVHIIAPVISGCAIAYFTYWLSKRDR